MKGKKEDTMWRFLLFVLIAWLAYRILRVVLMVLSASSQSRSRKRYDVGASTQKPPAMEFKDVQDAEFEEIPESEKPPK